MRKKGIKFCAAILLLTTTGAHGQTVQDIEIKHSLMVTAPLVVGDASSPPMRPDAWSFKHLITQMSGGFEPGQFIKEWMLQFTTKTTINGHKIPARAGFRTKFIDVWKAKDGNAGVSDKVWEPNLDNAPVRLSAIVYRPDLMRLNKRQLDGVGEVNEVLSAGEGRFVFQTTKADGNVASMADGTNTMTIIFEYDLVASTARQAIDWAREWKALSMLSLGSTEYLDKLELITRRFSDRNASLNRPNNVSLNQARTNGFFQMPWELREFRLGGGGRLLMDTVKVNPDLSFDNSPDLVEFLKQHVADPSAPLIVPARLANGKKFLGGNAPTAFAFKWSIPAGSVDPADLQREERIRRRLSLNTCNGCHAGETGTQFVHIDLRDVAAGNPARLSTFLTGTVPMLNCTKAEQTKTCADPNGNCVGDLKKRTCAMNALAAARPAELTRVSPQLSSFDLNTITMSLNPSGTVANIVPTTPGLPQLRANVRRQASSPTSDLIDFLRSRRDRVH